MKNKLFAIGVISALTFSTVFAEDNVYNVHKGVYLGGTVGAGLGAVKDNNGEVGGGFEGVGGSAYLGYQFTPYLGLEANYIGITAAFVNFNMFGLLVRGTLPVGNRFSLYAKAGAGVVNTSIDNIFGTGLSASHNDAAAMLGAGISLAVTQSTSLNVDYSGAVKNNAGMDGLYGALGLGLTYYFQ